MGKAHIEIHVIGLHYIDSNTHLLQLNKLLLKRISNYIKKANDETKCDIVSFIIGGL